MTRPAYLDTHDRARLTKWGKAHLVSRDQEKASLETECGRRLDQGGATEPMLGIMDKVLRFLPGRRGQR